jgi:hypothetical protein
MRTSAALFIVLLLAMAAMVAPARAQIAISPIIQETRLDQPSKVMSFRLTNFENRSKQVVVSVANWTINENGDVRTLPSDESSLDRWVIVSPLQFVLAPKGAQTIRVAVRPAVAMAPGEHRAMVYFDEVLAPRTAEQKGVRGRFRIGAAIYGYQGEPQRLGHIAGLKVDASGLSAQLTSEGNAHARLQGYYAIWRADAFPGLAASPFASLTTAPPKENWPAGVAEVSAFTKLPVLPGGRRPLRVPFGKLTPGNYVLEFRGGMSGVPAPAGLPFPVPAPVAGR